MKLPPRNARHDVGSISYRLETPPAAVSKPPESTVFNMIPMQLVSPKVSGRGDQQDLFCMAGAEWTEDKHVQARLVGMSSKLEAQH